MTTTSPVPLWLAVWLYLMIINAAAFAAFGSDKGRAERRERRIAEKDLLLFALIGGTAGAYLGRWYFRHKTRKRAFSSVLHVIAAAQAAVIAALVLAF